MNTEKLNNLHEMVISFQSGEEKGFDFFFRELFPSLCFFANRMLNNKCEAEDIASGAFIKIWNRYSQFDNAKNIRSYLYQIVRNDCLKFLQQIKRTGTMQKEMKYLSIADTQSNCEAEMIRAEFLGLLYKVLETLPTECRKVFKLLYIEGKTVMEISNELNISASTIKTQKSRGLMLLKKKFILF